MSQIRQMVRRRGPRRSRGSAAATAAGSVVLAVERGSAAPETAATPSRSRSHRRRRRSRMRQDRGAGGADEAAAASEQTEAPASDAIFTQGGSVPQPSCHLEGVAPHLSDSVLQTTSVEIMNSNKTAQRIIQAENKALKVSAADAPACSSLAHREPSVGETEASRCKLFERSDVRFPTDNCTAQGIDDSNIDYHGRGPNFSGMKSTDLSGNLEEVYRNRICTGCSSVQNSEECNENENGASLSSSSLKEVKKRIRKKRGGRRHNRCRKAALQDPPLPTASHNFGLMTIVSENNTSGLEPKGQREEYQNKVPIASSAPVDNERSEAHGVKLDGSIELGTSNLDGTIALGTSNLDGPIELGMRNLDSTFAKRFELGESSLDCTNLERNGLQERNVPCKSNYHVANYPSPSCLANSYLDGTIKKRCELGTRKFDNVFEKRCKLGESSLDCTNMEINGLQEQYLPYKPNHHYANYLNPFGLAEPYLASTIDKRCEIGTSILNNAFGNRYELGESSLVSTNMKRNGLQQQEVPCYSNYYNANYLNPYHSSEAYTGFWLGRPLVFLKKKLLILDLNGLLVDINEDKHNAHMADAKVRRKLVFRRPYCDDFLNFCALNFELGVWSSRKKENVASVVDIVMRDFKPCLLFCWDMSKCTFTGHKTLENVHKPLVLKELRKLWNKEEPDLPWEVGDYSASNTLLVDDSPYKALRNPPYTAIFPHSYSYMNWNDNSLGPGGDLRVYLQNLAFADDVQCFVRNNPFGQPPITESDPHWNFYAKIANKGRSPLTCARNPVSWEFRNYP